MNASVNQSAITADQLADSIVDAAIHYQTKGLSLFDLLTSQIQFEVSMEGTEHKIARVAEGGPMRLVRKQGDVVEMVCVGQMKLSLAGHNAVLHGRGSFHVRAIKGEQLEGGLLDLVNRRRIANHSGYLIQKFNGLSFSGPLGALVGSVFVFMRNGSVCAAARVAGIWLLPPNMQI